MLFVISGACAFSQDSRTAIKPKTPADVQKRIDTLLRQKQYPPTLQQIDLDTLVSLGTVITNDTVTYQLGKPRKKKKNKYTVVYKVRYAVKSDKIVSIDKPKRKRHGLFHKSHT